MMKVLYIEFHTTKGSGVMQIRHLELSKSNLKMN